MKNTVNNYYRVLRVIHQALLKSDKVDVNQIIKQEKVNVLLGTYLRTQKIIYRTGKGKTRSTLWTGNKPSLAMAKAAYKWYDFKRTKSKIKPPKVTITKAKVSPIQVSRPKTIQTKILFGLITLESKVLY